MDRFLVCARLEWERTGRVTLDEKSLEGREKRLLVVEKKRKVVAPSSSPTALFFIHFYLDYPYIQYYIPVR